MNTTVLLAGQNISLRPVQETDEPGIASAGRDPAIRELPWFGQGFRDHWAGPWVRRAIDEWAAGRNRTFSILDGRGHYIGSVNVGVLKDGAVEIAYWVLPEHRGSGVATQAVKLVLPWVRDTLPAPRVRAKTSLSNLASQRVLAKCGFEETARDRVVFLDWRGERGQSVHLSWKGRSYTIDEGPIRRMGG